MPAGAAEIAVGGDFQADVALRLHDLADRSDLDAAQLGGVDAAVGVVLPGLVQPLRAQQVGAMTHHRLGGCPDDTTTNVPNLSARTRR